MTKEEAEKGLREVLENWENTHFCAFMDRPCKIGCMSLRKPRVFENHFDAAEVRKNGLNYYYGTGGECVRLEIKCKP